MRNRYLSALTLSGIAFLLSGCAASLQTQNAATSATASSDGKVTQTGIVVPAASTHTIVLRMSGSTVATSASDWPRVQTEWREAMEGASKDASSAFVDETVKRTSRSGAGTVVDVYVEDFHFVAPGARYTLGIMTGNAFIQARVAFRDLQSGRVFGERSYNTSSSAWQGIFAPTSDKQARAIAADIVKQIDPR
ncbi:hypothetical protein NOV72_01710 [Caballeronia novacaledonica]|uniref:Lipoprotein n=1 Tax=Caballeronia novacaledonica TaxID=1544861 RepID=A0A2U3I2Z2_9BURK|nr:hypothetical protein [Caballeronia novacaledonica]SPB14468.1 hypothetical protein NOV72_01710 [Caballeronia novacaledonica]